MHSIHSVSTPTNLLRLKGSVQQYDWGKQGTSSLAARLANNAVGPEYTVDNKKCYAEVWMGTHPNGPARIYDSSPSSSEDLSFIKSDPKHYLGPTVLKKWPSSYDVPFLFKILSIAKALPLQAHPDKSLGEKLHKEDPSDFVDANHKPEIAVAIGDPLDSDGGWGEGITFIAFVGFKPIDDVQVYLRTVPELERTIGDDELVDQFATIPSKELFKKLYGKLLTRGAKEPNTVKKEVCALVNRIKSGSKDALGKGEHAEELAKLVLKMDAQYPGDVGVFATVFFMNFVKLKKGESVYIGADEIHTYLEGDIIECMSISDNVLNAAFVPTSQSTEHIRTFLNMLTYTSRPASHWMLPSEKYSHSKMRRTTVYKPPLEEFVVMGTHLTNEWKKEVLSAVEGPTIGIVTKGNVKISVEKGGEMEEIEEGGIVYIVPGCEVEVELMRGKGVSGEGEIWWAASMV